MPEEEGKALTDWSNVFSLLFLFFFFLFFLIYVMPTRSENKVLSKEDG